jgi:hypothetical protein
MVNSAVARYAIELQQGLSGTIGEVLEAATWDKERVGISPSCSTTPLGPSASASLARKLSRDGGSATSMRETMVPTTALLSDRRSQA